MTTFCIALYDNLHSTVHAIYTRRHVTHGGKISVKNAVRRIGQDNILLCKTINVHFSRKGSLSWLVAHLLSLYFLARRFLEVQ